MSKYISYPEYEQTGVDWLPEIPKGWKIGGLTKFLDNIVDYRGKTPEKVDEGIFLVTARNIKQGQINYDLSHEYIKTDDYEEVMRRGKPKIGDVLFTTEAPLGEVANVDREDIALAQRVIKFRALSEALDNYYLKYWILSHPFQSNLKTFATGSTAEGIKASKLSSLQVILPTIIEQMKIVKFLDKKTLEIDNLVRCKNGLITLLEQQRQSIITEAVTKGLNPNVKMKDSGVEWIGETPEHWDVTKIKYNTYVKGRIGWQGLKSDEFVNEGPFLVTGTDFKNGYVNWDTCYHISEERYEEAPPIQLRENDLLITKDGTIGKLAIVKDMPFRAILNSGVFVTRPVNNKYLSKYMYWLLSSNVFDKYISLMETGSTIKHLYQETFVNFSYPLPSIKEQEEIVEYLNVKISEIDNIGHLVKEQILKLKEYRQSLIYEAVTGKIDVRDMELD